MQKNRRLIWPVITAILGLLIVLISLPQDWKGWAPSFLRAPSLHLGLDLVGGTQLDFRISEEEIRSQHEAVVTALAAAEGRNASAEELGRLRMQKISIEQQQSSIVEAIRTVLERRINALGVSEATITPSYIGNEKHLLVECPGIIDTQECIRVVGKTIQLEFKEEMTQPTEEFTQGVRAKAATTMRRITESGSSLQKEGQDIGSQLGMVYQDNHAFFKDSLPQGLEDLWKKTPGPTVYQRDGSIRTLTQDKDGKQVPKDIPGIFLVQVTGPLTETGRLVNEAPMAFSLLSKSEPGASYVYKPDTILDTSVDPLVAGALRSMTSGSLSPLAISDTTAKVLFLRGIVKGKESVDVSHILVAYAGASEAATSVTRTKGEALVRAKELKAKIDAGTSFESVAKADSDGASTKATGGSLGPISRGSWPPTFEQAAFTQTVGTVSDPIETSYGYHLIRVNAPVSSTPDSASYDELTLTGNDASSRASELVDQMKQGKIKTTEQALPIRTLFFSLEPTGWKDTALNGKHFRSAAVTVDPVTNVPVVQIAFDDEGGRMFQELTKNNVGKRIAIFVGGQLVSAPVVQQEISGGTAIITGSANFEEAKNLALDLNTGAIPAPIYLVGQYTVEATLGAAALQTSLEAGLIGILLVMAYMILMYRMLGVVADLALTLYAVLLTASLKLPVLLVTSNYVVLTLAGMAGIILSIGMAVDANVLVFERMKEELRKGKLVKTAVEASFKHAWPAIRDSNVSSLITCAILFLIGSSIVRGFAVTLAIGVFLSLFTAVTVTRWLLRHLAATSLADKRSLFYRQPRGKPPAGSPSA
ncbi:MAG: protein translocase subunit SecD [Candidatus Peribacteraceae bacterium]